MIENIDNEERTRNRRIRDLLPEMQERYETTKGLQEQPARDQDGSEHCGKGYPRSRTQTCMRLPGAVLRVRHRSGERE